MKIKITYEQCRLQRQCPSTYGKNILVALETNADIDIYFYGAIFVRKNQA